VLADRPRRAGGQAVVERPVENRGFPMTASAEASRFALASSTAGLAATKLLDVVEIVGAFIAILLIIFLVAERARGRLQRPIAIVICVGPAVVLAMTGLVVPAINTFWLSLTNTAATGQKFQLVHGKLVPITAKFVGGQNYGFAFTDPYTRSTLIRTVFWIVVVPLVTVGIGLVLALLMDRMNYTWFFKTMIFMPTAISFVGASLIWELIYNSPVYTPDGKPGSQTGLLSQVVMWLGWKHPPDWIQTPPGNTFLLMMILIWIEVGFAMVVLGAALKAIPDEIVEAAQVDGATGYKLFMKVQIPMIRGTLVVVLTTITIMSLKIFDIVRTVTNGDFNTDVLARQMYDDLFVTFQSGRGAALAVILFLCVVPLVAYNIRQIRRQRAIG
jgi:alpha-glucoside transport system permease protein